MTSLGSGRIRRRVVAAGFTGMAGLLVLTSAAWAHPPFGIVKVSNPANGSYIVVDDTGRGSYGPGLTAARNDKVKVMAWEVRPGSSYHLWFMFPDSVSAGVFCPHLDSTTGVIMKTPLGEPLTAMQANEQGMLDSDPNTAGAQAYKALIPKGARVTTGGTAAICYNENPPFANYVQLSQHVHLTIL